MIKRQSNIELLRILSMFSVLILHSIFFTFGPPSKTELYNNILRGAGMYIAESMAITSVNVFVLISGWFRINFKIERLCSLLFQCIFFFSLIYTISIILGISSFSLKGVMQIFLLTDWNWFVLAYIGLYLLAPVLNKFLEFAGRKEIEMFLIIFFLFQTIYSWLFGAAKSFVAGYSTLSFIGLYVLSSYIRMFFYNALTKKTWKCFAFSYITIQFIHAVIAMILVLMDMQILVPKWYSYINPINVVSSLVLFICFVRFDFYSNIINKVSSLCFGAFLIHLNPWLTQSVFCKFIRYLNCNLSGLLYIIGVLLFLLFVFVLGCFFDRIRLFFWHKISHRFR